MVFDTLKAQDDPLYDNTVGILPPEAFVPRPGPLSIEVITTPDGFDNFDLGVDFAEPHLSSNPQNPLWFFNAWNTNATHFSFDGHDWTAQSPSFGFPMRGDPVTAYDSLGNLYYENMYGSPSILGCKVIKSTDNGATWTSALTAIDGVDKNWIAADQTMGPFANYVYTTMTAGGGVGNFARSTDLGATWTTTFSPSSQSLPGMMVAVGPNVLDGNNISGGCVYRPPRIRSTFPKTVGLLSHSCLPRISPTTSAPLSAVEILLRTCVPGHTPSSQLTTATARFAGGST
jgi:hypothetical protein